MQPLTHRLIVLGLAGAAAAFAQAPPAAETAWPAHSMERPRPPVVEPKYDGKPVPAPAAAVILFDGSSLESWKSKDQPAKWRLADGLQPPFPRPPDRPTGCFRSLPPKANS